MPQKAPDMLTIVRDTRNTLEYFRELGIESYPRSAAMESFLTGGKVKRHKHGPAIETKEPAPVSKTPSTGTPHNAEQLLQEIRARLGDCTRCPLCASRSNILFGLGNPDAGIIFVGEYPSDTDDVTATPFSGESGVLFDRMLAAINLQRSDIYLAYAVKCRPETGSTPSAEAAAACLPFLIEQILAIRPQAICTMGSLAAQALLKTNKSIIALRGTPHSFRGIPLIPTFHPDFLHHNPEMKKGAWSDLQMLQKKSGL
jgi:DNA polymerase